MENDKKRKILKAILQDPASADKLLNQNDPTRVKSEIWVQRMDGRFQPLGGPAASTKSFEELEKSQSDSQAILIYNPHFMASLESDQRDPVDF